MKYIFPVLVTREKTRLCVRLQEEGKVRTFMSCAKSRMPKYRNGGMEEWWNGGMVEWRNGGMQEWWNAGMVECRNGDMQEW